MIVSWPQIAKHMCPLTPPANIDKMWPLVEDALVDEDLLDEEYYLYTIATIRCETWAQNFLPTSERPSKWSGPNFELYNNRKDLGNGPTDGPLFRGRGIIQLTGRFNYERTGKNIGVDLISNPELANDDKISCQILADFLNQKRDQILEAMNAENYRLARRAVNSAALGLDIFTDAVNRGYQLLERDENA